ncbi:FemAB family PEP-CTERM system-associated protein [Simiduia curdlanivorans]|uniref:FemAB family XrtA/PEP-CTERM system-associated protein n=1 Tax=Simiduia curdlanivorans TaxID=1492769 RepID=A0ABV8V9Q9_9GAMM|nr:FemAB family XrtA/PEP-CTERM system-associated protein [Simiduia curdlanivorans]MDN3638496.1 FemAB family PEP-CTERM system-associated protein [Simiduia curdlanivorans]
MKNSEINTLRRKLKEKLDEKGATSSQFKEAKKPSPEFDTLINKMKDITDDIKAIEKQIKQLEKSPLEEDTASKNLLKPSVIYQNKHSNFSASFSIDTLQPESLQRWEHFVLNRKASVFFTSAWQAIIKASFNHDTIIIVAKNAGGEIIGGLPITIVSSALFGRMGVSVPYVNYGGVESDFLNVTKALLSHCNDIAITHKLKHVEVRTMQSELADTSISKKVSMVLKLPNSKQALESQLSAKVRAQYKKAEINSPSIKFGKLELLDDFYRVFSENMRDLGTPVYSRGFFQSILSTAAIKATIAVGYLEGIPVSTGFLIGNQDTLEIPWASTLKKYNHKNMNMWLYRQILDHAIDCNYDYFDFGRSTKDAGTYKFKKQWGAQPFEHHWYYFGSSQKSSDLNTDNPKLQLLIKAWKRLPVWLTRLIGPIIVRGIP